MRIAFDAKRAFCNYRGLGNYSRDVIRLFTTFAPENEYLLFTPKIGCFRFPNTQTLSPQGLWSLVPSLWRSFGCVNDMQNIDIYHGLSGELPYNIKKQHIRTVVTVHDAIFIRYPHLYSPTYRTLFKLKVQYACQYADTIIAISEQTKRDIVDYFHADESKIIVVYQGCNKIFRQPLPPDKVQAVKTKYGLPETYILDVGAIEPRKNIKNLLRAISIAKLDIPLVAIGAVSEYAKEVSLLAKQLDINLLFLHNVVMDDLPFLYKGAQVMVYPSVYEGFGIPILEAMAVGVPVLTSTGSCFAETGGDAALYANPLQPESISEQLIHILDNQSLRQNMITKGFQQADKFTDDKVATKLLTAVLDK